MNEERYITLRGPGDAEIEEKRSLFIGRAVPVSTEAEALAVLSDVRATYPDATHHVYAYVLRENATARYSDDHEPQGTAGLPVLDVLRKGNVTDAILVVTRYFGGTLLGTGGLVHAYSATARAALEAAGVGTRAKLARLRVRCSYPDYQKILPVIGGIRQEEAAFTDCVTLSLLVPAEEFGALCTRLSDTCGGRAALREDGSLYDFI